jgi:hypothetical protein
MEIRATRVYLASRQNHPSGRISVPKQLDKSKEAPMPKKRQHKSPKPAKRKQHNEPLHIPLTFEQVVDAMLKTPPMKKKPKK